MPSLEEIYHRYPRLTELYGSTTVGPADYALSSISQTNTITPAQRRKAEKEVVKRFLETGSPEGLKVYLCDGDVLLVNGDSVGNARTIFLVTPTQVLVREPRGKHLKAILTKLAEREGKELGVLQEAYGTDGAQRVNHYIFDHQPEIDDSALVTVTQPRTPQTRRLNGYNLNALLEFQNTVTSEQPMFVVDIDRMLTDIPF